jgi:peptidoglycan hydrolase CwlO-like protein
MPDESDETLVQHTIRGAKNAFTGCFGFLKKSDELTKIKYKETQIAGRKKKFGVEYLDLLAKSAEPAELEACVKKAQDDMKKIQDEIAELEKEVERVDEETKKKIVTKPTGGASPTEKKEEAKTEETPATTKPSPATETPVPAPAAPSAPSVETPAAQ